MMKHGEMYKMIDDDLIRYSCEDLKRGKREIAMSKACKRAGIDHISIIGDV